MVESSVSPPSPERRVLKSIDLPSGTKVTRQKVDPQTLAPLPDSPPKPGDFVKMIVGQRGYIRNPDPPGGRQESYFHADIDRIEQVGSDYFLFTPRSVYKMTVLPGQDLGRFAPEAVQATVAQEKGNFLGAFGRLLGFGKKKPD